jgi:hypothetical protein
MPNSSGRGAAHSWTRTEMPKLCGVSPEAWQDPEDFQFSDPDANALGKSRRQASN